MTYVYLMEDIKPLTKEIIFAHVEHLKKLNQQNKLVICGPFIDYPGGMVIFRASDIDEAHLIAKSDPFIALAYKTYEIRTFQIADEDNNYLL